MNPPKEGIMSEWSKTVLETIDSVVEISTEKVVRPAHKIARVSVYSLVAATLGILILFFLFIAGFRALTLVMEPWGVYLIFGGIFLGIGALLWAKK